MSATEIIFYAIAAVMLLSALGVTLVGNIVYAALFFIATLGGVAAVYLLLTVEFLALVQLLIYGGAVVILILFALMLTRARERPQALFGKSRPFGVLAAMGLLAGLIAAAVTTDWVTSRRPRRHRTGALRGDRRRHLYGLGRALHRRGHPALHRPRRRDPAGHAGRRGGLVPPIEHVLVINAILFAIGVMGVLTRRNAILILMSVEIMLSAVTLNLVAFAVYGKVEFGNFTGIIFAFFLIVVAAAEVALALGIVVRTFRNRATANVDEVNLLKW